MSITLTPDGQVGLRAAGLEIPPRASGADEKLLEASQNLEAVFLNQLFKAMRETVPEGGLLDGGEGEELFTGMLDATMSEAMAKRLERGMAAGIYRQMQPLLRTPESKEQGS